MKSISFFLLLAFLSCTSSNKTPQAEVESLIFGESGGFTGQIISHTLTSEGILTKSQQLPGKPENILAQNTIDKKTANDFLKKAKMLNGYHYHQTGNMNFFLNIKTKNYSENFNWTDPTKIDSRLLNLYTELMSHTK